MSSVVATVIKLKNESRVVVAGVCTSSCEVLAGWLVVVTDMVGTIAASSRLASFGCFGCCLDFFLAIDTFLGSFGLIFLYRFPNKAVLSS